MKYLRNLVCNFVGETITRNEINPSTLLCGQGPVPRKLDIHALQLQRRNAIDKSLLIIGALVD